MPAKILAFAGSTRTESWNKKLIRIAAEGARAEGAEVTLVDLRDFPMPLYDGDLEAQSGIPEHGKRLKKLFLEHGGLLISSPEYNSSVTGVPKNAIDWVSRPEPNEPSLAAFIGKVAGLVSASPGALGGQRALVHLRSILGNIKTLVIPEQVSVPKANEAFNPDGTLKDAKLKANVENVGRALAKLVAKLQA
ncbi:MAG TPA: NAD(P)H-dependent oxidoreductase [Planctomycetota bacterium]|nr:NAD(P)H-dependent oxidoreductase [Planctomycetota bacterium]